MGVLKGVGIAIKGFGKALRGKGKVSPTITSVKPTTKISTSVQRVKDAEYRKRYTALDKANEKVKTGKKMMLEGQKERKRMVDTGRAFQFKGGSRHAVKPGENPKEKYKGLLKEDK